MKSSSPSKKKATNGLHQHTREQDDDDDDDDDDAISLPPFVDACSVAYSMFFFVSSFVVVLFLLCVALT